MNLSSLTLFELQYREASPSRLKQCICNHAYMAMIYKEDYAYLTETHETVINDIRSNMNHVSSYQALMEIALA